MPGKSQCVTVGVNSCRALPYIICVLLMSSCASAGYRSYTSATYSPKPNSYDVPLYKDNPFIGKNYITIGAVTIRTSTGDFGNWDTVKSKVKSIARKKGADAIINVRAQARGYTGSMYMPSVTKYETVTTQHGGSASGNVYGQSGYSGRYDGTYSGSSTTKVPVSTPQQEIPYEGAVYVMEGDLIVFQNPANNTRSGNPQRWKFRLRDFN